MNTHSAPVPSEDAAQRPEMNTHSAAPVPSEDAAPDMYEGFEAILDLADKAMKKSGDQFFQVLQRRIAKHLEGDDPNAEDFEAAQHLITPEALKLLARWYAGDIEKPKKRSRSGAITNYGKLKPILEHTVAKKVLDTILLAELLDKALDECGKRSAAAAESEHWTRDVADVDPADMWSSRADAIDEILGPWQEAAEAAKKFDWEELESKTCELDELDAEF